IGIRPDPGVDGLAHITPAGHIVEEDIFASYTRFDQLRHQGLDGMRARQTIQRRPGMYAAPRTHCRGRHSPRRGPVLVAVDLDRDLLSGPVSGIAQLPGLIEAPEQRVPSLLVVLP